MNVEGKIVVITGGASGIGFSCAEQFLHHNAKVVAIFDLPNEKAKAAVTKLKRQSDENRVAFYPCDITNKEQVETSFNRVMKEFGSFDILLNSAGRINEEEWDLMVDVNISGIIRANLTAIDLIGKHKGGKGGTIVNIASMAGLTPVSFMPIYCATKYAIVGFTISISLNYERTGISMLLMCPGVTATPMTSNRYDHFRLSFTDHDEGVKDLLSQSYQPPEIVGKTTIQLIEKGENGTVCVVNNSEPYLVDIATINDLVKHQLES